MVTPIASGSGNWFHLLDEFANRTSARMRANRARVIVRVDRIRARAVVQPSGGSLGGGRRLDAGRAGQRRRHVLLERRRLAGLAEL
jgi:hypothetical protein